MANVIKPKRSNTASAVPTTGQLASGELAVNMADQKVYINNGTSVVQVGAGNLTGLGDVNVTSPTNNQILKYDSATSKWINGSGGGGSGDVVGPVSSTDNAITRFDGSTGTLIQNSTVTLDDDGNVINVNSLGLDTTPATVPATVGTMSWDDGDGVPSVLLKGGNTTLQIGTQEYARVYNDSGSTLTRGQVVYIFGAQGNRVSVKLARADVEATSYGTIGFVSETIANGAEGFIIVSGALYKLDTSALTAGATVYLSPTTAGAITTTKPQAPNQLVVLGWVERVHATAGSIYVKIDNGYELDELHDVQINSPVSGNLLIYDATTSPIGVWKNASLTAGTAISVTNGAGSVTINNTGVTSAVAGTGISVSSATGAVTVTNTAPDQTVALSAGTGISTSGTYPNFTITNTAPDQTVAISAGTGMSVSGTYPNFTVTNTDLGSSQSIFKNFAVAGQSNIVADSNNDTLTVAAGTGISLTTNATTDTLTITNSAPDQTVALSAGTGISVSGTYPNFTITNTSPSSGGTVTSVSGAGGYGGLTLTGTVTSSGSLTLGGTPTGTWPISVSGSAASATTATNQSGGTVNATTGSFSSQITSTLNTASGLANNSFNVSKSILGNFHLANGAGSTSNNGNQAAITFMGGSASESQAGIYVSNNNSIGTAMGFATTDSYAAGPQLFLTATNGGVVNFPRARPTYAGNVILDAGNYNSYAPTLTGGGASGTWSINITGSAGSATTAGNVTGTVAIANGGTGATTAPNARTNLGATTVGSNMFTLTNPSAVTFPRFNADNTVSALDAATFRSAIGAGTGSGTVTSVSGTGTVSGLTLSGTVTTSGSLTLGGSISFPVTSVNGSTGAVTVPAITATSGSPLYYGSRCWVNFTGTGTVTANISVNVSSVTDNGIGLYTVNFSTAMPDANYVTVVTNSIVSGLNGSTTDTAASNGGRVYTCFMCISAATAPTTSAVRVSQGNSYYSGESYDPGRVNVVIFR